MSAGAKFAKFWFDNKVIIVMGGLLGGGHYTWRWLQDQEDFVPKGEEKQYPWIEAAIHIKNAKADKAAAAEAAEAAK